MTWSRMPVCARPVRTFARSALKASTLLFIFVSVFFFRSGITTRSLGQSQVHQGALVLAGDHAAEGSLAEDAEHVDRQLLVTAQRERGRVHHLEIALDRLVEADAAVAFRARVRLRIASVHAVHLGGLEHDLGADLA